MIEEDHSITFKSMCCVIICVLMCQDFEKAYTYWGCWNELAKTRDGWLGNNTSALQKLQ